jgi:hypothetical protein
VREILNIPWSCSSRRLICIDALLISQRVCRLKRCVCVPAVNILLVTAASVSRTFSLGIFATLSDERATDILP